MKRIILALAVGGALFAAAFAAAATLGVNGGVIQAGSDGTLYCDTDGVAVVGWGLEMDDGMVYSVRIGGVNGDACAGADLFALVRNGGGTKLTDGGPVAIVSGTTEYRVTFDSAVDASAIESISVWIEGGAP